MSDLKNARRLMNAGIILPDTTTTLDLILNEPDCDDIMPAVLAQQQFDMAPGMMVDDALMPEDGRGARWMPWEVIK